MSNPYKLVLVVLLFFLALTFVRGFTATGESSEITFLGTMPIPFVVNVSNSSLVELKPRFLADGPFSIVFRDDPSTIIVSPRSTRAFTLYLIPTPVFRVRDAYTSQIRVVSVNEESIIPLSLTKKEGPILDASGVTGFASAVASRASATINAVLAVIVLVLLIALVARVKNRVLGGNEK